VTSLYLAGKAGDLATPPRWRPGPGGSPANRQLRATGSFRGHGL